MKNFDFTTVIDRTDTSSWQYEAFDVDVLPAWLADMNFRAPPCVLEALHKSVDHGIFGYSTPSHALRELILERLSARHNWQTAAESLVFLPGLVTALNVAARLLNNEAEVLVPIPAYGPFLSCAPNQGKKTVTVPMAIIDGIWRFDLAALQAAVTPQTTMLILCNPHNPTGRSLQYRELAEIADFVQRNNLLLLCDEIHCDLILDPAAKHLSIAAEFPEIAEQTITLLSPSKTFNLAGIGCAFAVIANKDLRERFQRGSEGLVPHISQPGLVAMEAAYRDGEEWRRALIEQLRSNLTQVVTTIENMPALSMIAPQATYLAWIDCQRLRQDDPSRLFLRQKLALGAGRFFGADQFVRFNFALPPSTLSEALQRLRADSH